MKKVIALILMVFVVLSVVPTAWASVDIYEGSSVDLDMKGMAEGVCGHYLVVVGTKEKDKTTYEAIALLDLSDADSPRVVKEMLGGSEHASMPITDIVCAGDVVYILRNNVGSGPWLTPEAWHIPELEPIDVPGNKRGLTGLYVKDSWAYRPGLYLITPFSGDSLMWFYDGRLHKVEIDDSAVPQLVAAMSYLQRVFQLSKDTLLLVGQGAYVVKMSDATHGKVISYVNVDVTSGGEPIYLGYDAQKIGDIVVGWYPGDTAKGFYFYDIKKKEAYYKEYAGAEHPDKLASFGNYLYALVSPKDDGYSELFTLNVRSGESSVKALNKLYVDIVAYMGRLYLLSADAHSLLSVYSSSIFTDMTPDHWAYAAAAYLIAHGVLSGYPDGSFKPDKEVTRAEYAKVLATSLNLDIAQCHGFGVFKDVKDSDWFCPYVRAVYKAGYMVGYGKGQFAPTYRVKKEEILTTIVRIKG